MEQDARIYVAGHRGLVGSALIRCLHANGFENLILRSREELDLTHADSVQAFFAASRPEYVFLAAGKVGGIGANAAYPADFIRDNLAMELNVIDAAWRNGSRKFLFFGSSCIYPKFAPQPIKEDCLLASALEPSNEPYALAKIAGLKLCQAYRDQYGFGAICCMPANLYGPGDRFDLQNSHVLAALLRKVHEANVSGASQVVIWGTGTPRREFLHADDLAEAALFLMQHYDGRQIVNVGTGKDLSIAELSSLIAGIVGYHGAFVFDPSKPDGTPRKLLDLTRIHDLGWRHRINLQAGIRSTYEWFREHCSAGAGPILV